MEEILHDLPPREPSLNFLVQNLNNNVARFNAHYKNTLDLGDTSPEAAEGIPVTELETLVRIKGSNRQYLLDLRYLGINHFGQLIDAIQHTEAAAGAAKLVDLAESVQRIYEVVFPETGEDPGAQGESDAAPEDVQ
jgi:hypothetical protein